MEKKFTTRKAHFIYLIEQGMEIQEAAAIASEGVNTNRRLENWLYHYVQQNERCLRVIQMAEKEYTEEQIAEATGYHISTVIRIMKRQHAIYSSFQRIAVAEEKSLDKEEILADLIQRNYSIPQIARAMGITERTFEKYFREYLAKEEVTWPIELARLYNHNETKVTLSHQFGVTLDIVDRVLRSNTVKARITETLIQNGGVQAE